MPITLISGPANAGKAQLVLDAVRGELARGCEPLLVVPTRADAEQYLRELAAGGSVIGARVERFDGLIEEIARRAHVGTPTLGELARRRLITRLALEAGLAGDGAQGPARGLERALADFISELEVRRVSPERLSGVLARCAGGDGSFALLGRLGELYRDYRRELARIGRLDPRQRAVRALDAVRREPSLWGATPVLLYGFDDLSELQLDVVETLGRVVDARVTVSLTYEPGRVAFAGRAATVAALAPIAHEHRSLGAREDYYAPVARAALAHLERSLFELDSPRAAPAGASATTASLALLEGGGERAELELVAARVRALLDAGVPGEQIALVTRTPELLADLLEEVLAAAGVPFALQRRRSFASSATGRALVAVLRCVPAPGRAESDGTLADLLAWLRTPGMLEHARLADVLELRAQRAGIAGADAARALWERHNWSLDRIERLREAQQQGPSALLDRAQRELSLLFAAPRRAAAEVLHGAQVDEARALAAAQRALAELRELAELAPELVPGRAAELADELEQLEFVSGEPPGAGAVAVLDPLALRARRVRALFLFGLQEGVFPARARPHGLLSERERIRINEVSGLRLGAQPDTLEAERYLFYAAVSRPEELLVLSWHAADDDGQATPRSLFVDDICDLFDASLPEHTVRRASATIGSLAAGGEDTLARDGAGARAADGPLGGGVLRDEHVLAELRARPWSASGLEAWMSCPVRWFVERVLRPGALEPDAEPLARGALAHAALKETFEQLRREQGSARLRAGNLQRARELLGDALVRLERERPLILAPERLPGTRRRMRAELERYLEYAAGAASPLEPELFELSFGFDEDGALAPFELDAGVALRGRIDRVDASGAGEAVVYDYKASNAPPAARWLSDRSVQVALYMLAVEALLARPVAGGLYQPLSGGDLRARGALDASSALALDSVGPDTREHDEFRELLDEALALARAAAAEARAGRLEARPHTCAYHGGCMYPSICRCES